MFHVRRRHVIPGTSGIVQDTYGPVSFESKEEAQAFIDVCGYTSEDVEIIGAGDQPFNPHNPGGIPQVGSSRNPALFPDGSPKQVHPQSVEMARVERHDAETRGRTATTTDATIPHKDDEGKSPQEMAKKFEQPASAEHPGTLREAPSGQEGVGLVSDAALQEQQDKDAEQKAEEEKQKAETEVNKPPQP